MESESSGRIRNAQLGIPHREGRSDSGGGTRRGSLLDGSQVRLRPRFPPSQALQWQGEESERKPRPERSH